MRKPYPSDLTDEQWEIVRPLIPVSRVGRPREVDMREVLNAIFYLDRAGCPWDMLPHDFPPKSTVYEYVVTGSDEMYSSPRRPEPLEFQGKMSWSSLGRSLKSRPEGVEIRMKPH